MIGHDSRREAYLETGEQMYDDVFVPDDGLDEIIEEVKKYY